MNGRPVTLDSIRELNESEQSLAIEHQRASTIRRIIMLIFGMFLIGASVVTLIFTVFVAFGVGHYNVFNGITPDTQWAFIIAYILAIIAGVLLSVLFAVCAYVAFSLNINKRIIISIVIIVITGLASFGTAVGLVSYQSLQINGQIQRETINTKISVPAGFSDIKNITADAKSINIKYVVDNNYRIEYKSLLNDDQPKILVDANNLNIEYSSAQSARWPQLQPTLTIYGPKIDKIMLKNGNVEYLANKQDMNIETVGRNSSVNLVGGTFVNLVIVAKDGSSISADKSTVENALINSETSSTIELGNVKTLDITQPEACPADTSAEVSVQNVAQGMMRYNGKDLKVSTYDANCGSIDIDNIK